MEDDAGRDFEVDGGGLQEVDVGSGRCGLEEPAEGDDG